MHPKKGDFKGVYSAIITPYGRDGKLDEDVFRKVMEFDIQAGVDGFWVAGGAGESVYLTEEERIRLAELSVDQARGRAKIILHAGSWTTASTVRIAKGAKAAGVDAIASVPPLFYHPSDRSVVEYFKAVGAASGLPLFLYNWPGATGTEILPPLMDRIASEVPELAGLKHSVMNFAPLRIYARSMGLTVFVGSSQMLLPALTLGAVGTIDGPPGVFPEEYVEVYRAYAACDLKRAEAAQERANKFHQFVWSGPYLEAYHAVFKALLSARLGVDCGAPRPPLLPLSAAQKRDLLGQVSALGLAAKLPVKL